MFLVWIAALLLHHAHAWGPLHREHYREYRQSESETESRNFRWDFALVDPDTLGTTRNGSGLLVTVSPDTSEIVGTVCDDLFSGRAAALICRNMGYTCAYTWGAPDRGEGISAAREALPISVDDLNCPDDASSISDCSVTYEHNCFHNEDMFMECGFLCDYEFNLVDGNGADSTNGSGLVIASRVGTTQKGTVCDDQFTGLTANILCKAMGYTCTSRFWSGMYAPAIQEKSAILLDDVECPQSAEEFGDCNFELKNNCEHREDVFLDCNCLDDLLEFKLLDYDGTTDNTTTGQGILFVHSNDEDKVDSGTVCYESATKETIGYVCQNLGFDCSMLWTSVNGLTMDHLPAIGDLSCIDQDVCLFSRDPDQSCSQILLACGTGDMCTGHSLEFKLVGMTGEVTNNGSGLLVAASKYMPQIRGTVCDDGFTILTSKLICQQMGHACSLGWEIGADWPIQAKLDIRMDEVDCEGASAFSECTFAQDHNCAHSEDVVLSCGSDCSMRFKLIDQAGQDSSGQGLLIASQGPTGEGTVCDDGFGKEEADIICREMNFGCSMAHFSKISWNIQSQYDIFLDNVNCEGAERFDSCLYQLIENCDHSEDIYLFCATECDEASETSVSFTLEKADIDKHHLLLASRHFGEQSIEGTVCNDHFDDLAGSIICQNMGYACLKSFTSRSDLPQGTNATRPILLDDIQCSSSDSEDATFEENCQYSLDHNCGHGEDIYLQCGTAAECVASSLVFKLVDENGQTSRNGRGLLVGRSSTDNNEGTVCGTGFTDETAGNICRFLGYSCVQSWTQGVSYQELQYSYRIAASEVVCGSEHVAACTFLVGPGRCSHQQDIQLSCANFCIRKNEGTLMPALMTDTMAVSTNGSGLLVLTYKTQESQSVLAGTVCRNDMTMDTAHVLCKKMGYTCARRVYTEPWAMHLGSDVLMSGLKCSDDVSGFGKLIESCTFSVNHHCGHDRDVFLECGGVLNVMARAPIDPQSFSSEGVRNPDLIVDGSLDTFEQLNSGASIMIQFFGFYVVFQDDNLVIDTVKIYVIDARESRDFRGSVSVNGNEIGSLTVTEDEAEITISLTPLVLSTVTVTSTVGSIKIAEVMAYNSKVNGSCEAKGFSLVDEHLKVSSNGYGLLKANWMQGHNLNAKLREGTVCDDGFSLQAASAICKDMGYECATYWQSGNAESVSWGAQYLMEIVMYEVECKGDTPDISNCTFDTTRMNCDHSEDVFISCDNRLDSLGCWSDEEGEAIPSLEGSFPYSNETWRERKDPISACRRAAESKGWTVFAIQGGGWCASSEDAARNYQRYGAATNCRSDGTGGYLANNVYRITGDQLEELGCWLDKPERAIPSLEHEGRHSELTADFYMRHNPISDCKNAAQSKGWPAFAISRDGQCLSSADALDTYQRFGKSDKCKPNGLGGYGALQMYKIRDGECGKKQFTYDFTLMDENWTLGAAAGLLIVTSSGYDELSTLEGTVCDDNFNRTAAQIICKSMGFKCVTSWGNSHGRGRAEWEDIQSKYSILLDDIECGNENLTFSECTFKRNSNCLHSEDIFLSCNDHCQEPTYDFKLIDMKTMAEGDNGLLVATYNDTTETMDGTVCDDLFNLETGHVICKSMGFQCARDFYTTDEVSETQQGLEIVLDNVVCNEGADEFSTKTCTFVKGHNCDHHEDIHLSCKKTQAECDRKEKVIFSLVNLETGKPTDDLSGVVVANRTEQGGKVGTVCDDNFSSVSADILCREIGFKAAATWVTADGREWMWNYTTAVDDVTCPDNATNFNDCTYNPHHDCSHYENIFLVCSNTKINNGLSFYIVNQEGHQITSGLGLLIAHRIKAGGGPVTGTVCSPGFSQETASVVCKQMGYDHVSGWEATNKAWGVQRAYASLVTDFACTDPTNISQCTFKFNFTCGHDHDVFISCNPTEYTRYMCPAGSQFETNKCEPCAQNTFKDVYNDDPCKACPEGSVSNPGADHCVKCGNEIVEGHCTCGEGAVFHSDIEACLPCPGGQYKKGHVCTPCPEGSDSEEGSSSCDCGTAAVWSEEGECSACPTDHINIRNTCTACSLGVVGGRCRCEEGSGWDLSGQACVPCGAGEFVGNLGCEPCPEYTVPLPNKTACAYCADNEYWADHVCMECAEDSVGRLDQCIPLTAAASKSASDKSWLIPAIVAGILCVLCIILSALSVRFRREVVVLRKRGTAIEVEELGDLTEMSFDNPHFTHDGIQLLAADTDTQM